MNDILFDYLNDFYIVYLNNILVYSNDLIEYTLYIRKVLKRLKKVGLELNIKKCEFNTIKIKYLGFIISIDGIEVDPKKVAIIKY